VQSGVRDGAVEDAGVERRDQRVVVAGEDQVCQCD
jgi:hypothetical protein